MEKSQRRAIFFALLAAALYALNSPFSKLLLSSVSPTMMAAFLYLGAGTGALIMGLIGRLSGKKQKEQPLTRREQPYTLGMIILDIAAPVFLMIGLGLTTAANASLLNNFEIVATSLTAMLIFKEGVSKRLWLAIALITLSSIILSFEDMSSLSFSAGSVFVILACICWGFENNCTRMLSSKDPLETVVIKGLCSGTGSLIIALIIGERLPSFTKLLCAMLLGFVAYGLSIYFYIYAQRLLGAAKTSSYYAIAPFIGTAVSLLIFRQTPSIMFVSACAVMAVGTYFASTD